MVYFKNLSHSDNVINIQNHNVLNESCQTNWDYRISSLDSTQQTKWKNCTWNSECLCCNLLITETIWKCCDKIWLIMIHFYGYLWNSVLDENVFI